MFRKLWGRPAPAAEAAPEPPEPPEPPAPVAGLPMARLPVANEGKKRLALILEPWGSEEWVEPGEKVTVVTIGRADGDRPWSGSRSPHEPFEVQYYADMLVVWPNGSVTILEDADGNELLRW
ncbi:MULTISPECIES: hypothetical protein [unclassified Streptomyces]|uniref:hypothetical protein n=1 Tax=unclassified Streptomyces TaxID=2593676 RepID=UPI00068E781C|nr:MULTISPECIES: hypothetical protein [unclassified Streptomyces]